jgi:hypothetical protein
MLKSERGLHTEGQEEFLERSYVAFFLLKISVPKVRLEGPLSSQ